MILLRKTLLTWTKIPRNVFFPSFFSPFVVPCASLVSTQAERGRPEEGRRGWRTRRDVAPAITYAAAGGEASMGAVREEGEAGMDEWRRCILVRGE